MKINIPHNIQDEFYWEPSKVDGVHCVRLRPTKVLDGSTLYQNREEETNELHTPTS